MNTSTDLHESSVSDEPEKYDGCTPRVFTLFELWTFLICNSGSNPYSLLPWWNPPPVAAVIWWPCWKYDLDWLLKLLVLLKVVADGEIIIDGLLDIVLVDSIS